MKHQCRRCGVYVEDGVRNCPLCGAFVSEEKETSSIYEFPSVNLKTAKMLFFKILLFITIFAVAIVFAIDLAVNKTIVMNSQKVSWSLHVIIPIALLWVTVFRCIFKGFNARQHLAWDFMGLIALFFYIEFASHSTQYHWAFNLATPIAVLVWQTVLEILYFAHRSGRDNYQVALTRLCVLSGICIGISYLWLKDCDWGWYVCTSIGIVDILAMLMFDKESYLGTLKQKLHI